MCFTRRLKDRVARITPVDIVVYKVLTVDGKILRSPSYYTIWKPGQVVTSKLVTYFDNSSLQIEEGLHSKKTFSGTKGWTEFNPARKVFKAVIPKGSFYWENKTEYVSNQLKIVSDVPLTKSLEVKKRVKK